MVNLDSYTAEYHPQCIKVKEAISKPIQEYANLFWICAVCLTVIKQKLATNSRSPSGKKETNPVNEKFLTTAVDAAVNSKISIIESHNKKLISEISNQLDSVKQEMKVLKESNVDLVRLLTFGELASVSKGSAERKKGVNN
ncbi:hypothetical protein HHI36_009723 [Cryptolaemus montrouzieri]|uniref:Uncharacterized protein n=1 Tax=Cryptolaemus montrouzieri TaxID=559131 RepID=A0ABD2MGN5_9CUCU